MAWESLFIVYLLLLFLIFNFFILFLVVEKADVAMQ